MDTPTNFVWVLGIQTQVFKLAWQAIYPQSHVPSPYLLLEEECWVPFPTYFSNRYLLFL